MSLEGFKSAHGERVQSQISVTHEEAIAVFATDSIGYVTHTVLNGRNEELLAIGYGFCALQ